MELLGSGVSLKRVMRADIRLLNDHQQGPQFVEVATTSGGGGVGEAKGASGGNDDDDNDDDDDDVVEDNEGKDGGDNDDNDEAAATTEPPKPLLPELPLLLLGEGRGSLYASIPPKTSR